MAQLLHPDPDIQSMVVRSLPISLQTENRGILFELGWRIAAVLQTDKSSTRLQHHKLPRDEIVKVLALGSRILCNWPDTINIKIREGYETNGADFALSLANKLRAIFNNPQSWPEHVKIVKRDAAYITGGIRGILNQSIGNLLNAEDATAFLGISSNKFRVLEMSEPAEIIIKNGSMNRHGLFSKLKLAPLKRAISARINVGAVVEKLGVPAYAVEQMVCLKLIKAVSHPSINLLYDGLQIDKDSAALFYVDFRNASTDIHDVQHQHTEIPKGCPKATIPILHALRTIGGRKKPWGPIIKMMIEGKLMFSFAVCDRQMMNAVHVYKKDIPLLRSLCFDETNYDDFVFSDTITKRDCQELLNSTPQGVQNIIDLGIETEPCDKKELTIERILKISRGYISNLEINHRWFDGDTRSVRNHEKLKAIQRFGRLGFLRSTVELALGPDCFN